MHKLSASESLSPALSLDQPSGRRIALVIGNNGSEHEPLAPLHYAEQDASEMARVLVQPACGFELLLPPLVGAEATTAAVRRAVLQLARERTDDDFLLLYFSGHGLPLHIEAGRQDVYLVTSDFSTTEVSEDAHAHLSLGWLREKLYTRTDAGRVLVVLDCCYAGNMGRVTPDPYLQELHARISYYFDAVGRDSGGRSGGARLALTATGHDMPALERDGHGLMTSLMLPALRGEVENVLDDQGHLTLPRLYEYLHAHMLAEQPPALSGDSAGRSCMLAYYDDKSAAARLQRAEKDRQRQAQANRSTRLQAMLADHSGFMSDRLGSFVGRTQELVEIRGRITEKLKTGGYVTITGQAGQGKSSIIAKLVSECGPQQVAHHFIPFNPGPDHQISLLRNLMAHLILRYDLSDLYIASESRPALRDYLKKVLGEIVAKGGQEIIFIDGLDQLEEEFTGVRDLSFLPTNPPPGIVFVLGTRPNDTLKPLELLKPHHEYRLPNLTRADFDLILEHRRVTLDAALADRFYSAMQKNALYLDLVAKELTEASTTTYQEIIRRIADNPDNLFSITMDRLKRHATRWREIIKPTLGVLLAAREPLGLRSLRALIGADDDALRDELARLGGLVARDGEGRYYLYHLKLQEYLRQHEQRPEKQYIFATDEEQGWHARMAAWCEAVPGGLESLGQDDRANILVREQRHYARQHYITHLYLSKNWPKLWSTLDDGVYGRAKLQHDPSTRAYAQDLDLGRLAAAHADHGFVAGITLLPNLWRYSLLRCSLASQADSYPEELFDLMTLYGREKEALGLAELLTDGLKKVKVLTTIGVQLIEQGTSKQEGREILLRAFETALAIHNPLSRPDALSCMMGAFIVAREWDQAINAARAMSYGARRAEELVWIAEKLVDSGQHALALPLLIEVALTLADNTLTSALPPFPPVMPYGLRRRLGRFDSRRFLRRPTSRYRVHVPSTLRMRPAAKILAHAITILMTLGAWGHAVHIAYEVPNSELRLFLLAVIAEQLVGAGEAERALMLLSDVVLHGDIQAIAAIINFRSNSNLPIGTREYSVELLEDTGEKTALPTILDRQDESILTRLAAVFAHLGAWKQSIKVMCAIREQDILVVTLARLINILIAADEQTSIAPLCLELAAVARTIKQTEARADTLAWIAEKQIEIGQQLAARQLLTEAAGVARTAKPPSICARLLTSIAIVLRNAGDQGAAVRLLAEAAIHVGEIEESETRYNSMAWIAEQLIELGAYEQAIPLLSEAVLAANADLSEYSSIQTGWTRRSSGWNRLQRRRSFAVAAPVRLPTSQLRQLGDTSVVLPRPQAYSFSGSPLVLSLVALVKQGAVQQALDFTRKAQNSKVGLTLLIEAVDLLLNLEQQSLVLPLLLEVAAVARASVERDLQADMLVRVMGYLIRLGEKMALPLLDEVLSIVHLIDNNVQRLNMLDEVIEQLSEACAWDEAITVAHTIPDHERQWQALDKVIERLIAAGEMAKAQVLLVEVAAMVPSIEDLDGRENALKKIAMDLSEVGSWELVVAIVPTIADFKKRQEALDKVIERLITAGEMAKAQVLLAEIAAMVPNIEDFNERQAMLGEIAEYLSKVGVWEKAVSVARMIDDDEKRRDTLSNVAEHLIEVEAWEEAATVGREIEYPHVRARILTHVAEATRAAGIDTEGQKYVDAAVTAARVIADGEARLKSLAPLAEQLFITGKVTAGKGLLPEICAAFKIGTFDLTFDVSLELSKTLLAMPSPDAKKLFIDALIGAARDSFPPLLRIAFCFDLALHIVDADEAVGFDALLTETQNLMVGLDNPGVRVLLVLSMIEGLKNVQRQAAFLPFLKSMLVPGVLTIENMEKRHEALVEIIDILINFAAWNEAVSVARAIDDPASQYEILTSLVETLLKHDQRALVRSLLFDVAATARRIKTSKLRAEALLWAARELLNLGEQNTALPLLVEAGSVASAPHEEVDERIEQLTTIAQLLITCGAQEFAQPLLLEAARVAVKSYQGRFRGGRPLLPIPHLERPAPSPMVAAFITLTSLGAGQQALELAREIQNPRLYVELIAHIAAEMTLVDDQALLLFDEAVQHARQVDVPFQRYEVLDLVARQLLKLGSRERATALLLEAVAAAREIKDGQSQVTSLGHLAQTCSEAGDQASAVSLLLEAAAIDMRTMAESGSGPPVQLRLGMIRNVGSRSPSSHVITQLIQMGATAQALEVVHTIGNRELQTSLLVYVAAQLSEVEQSDQALPLLQVAAALVDEIEDGEARSRWMAEVAEGLIKEGAQATAAPLLVRAAATLRFDETLEQLLRESQEQPNIKPPARSRPSANIGSVIRAFTTLSTLGTSEQINAVIHALEDRQQRMIFVVKAITELLLQKAQAQMLTLLAEAATAAGEIESLPLRSASLIWVAVKLVELGQWERARLLLIAAADVAYAIEQHLDRARQLTEIVELLVAGGDQALVRPLLIEAATAIRLCGQDDQGELIQARLVTLFQVVEDQERVLELLQESWLEATNRSSLLKQLPLVAYVDGIDAELVKSLAESFVWVDHFLGG